MRPPTAEEMDALFAGRRDVVNFDGRRTIRLDEVAQQNWAHLWADHLSGKQPISIYHSWVEDGETWTRWGAFDVDRADDLNRAGEEAVTLDETLCRLGFHPHLEPSRSKGFHVWLFAEEPVPNWAMKGTLLHALKVSGVPADVELRPVQWRLEGDSLGTSLRIPMAGNRATGRQFLDVADALENRDGATKFRLTALEGRMVPSSVHPLGRIPDPPHMDVRKPSGEVSGEAARVLSGGHVSRGSRDNTLWQVTVAMHRAGYSREEAMDCMRRVYENQMDRSSDFPFSRLADKVRRAWR